MSSPRLQSSKRYVVMAYCKSLWVVNACLALQAGLKFTGTEQTADLSNTPCCRGGHLQAWRHVCLLETLELLPLAVFVQVVELLQLLVASWGATLTCQGGAGAFPEQQEGLYWWALLCLMRLLQKGLSPLWA